MPYNSFFRLPSIWITMSRRRLAVKKVWDADLRKIATIKAKSWVSIVGKHSRLTFSAVFAAWNSPRTCRSSIISSTWTTKKLEKRKNPEKPRFTDARHATANSGTPRCCRTTCWASTTTRRLRARRNELKSPFKSRIILTLFVAFAKQGFRTCRSYTFTWNLKRATKRPKMTTMTLFPSLRVCDMLSLLDNHLLFSSLLQLDSVIDCIYSETLLNQFIIFRFTGTTYRRKRSKWNNEGRQLT